MICQQRSVVQGVELRCDKEGQHTVHYDPTWGVTWPQRTPPHGSTKKPCLTEGCNLWLGHGGSHGEQMTL